MLTVLPFRGCQGHLIVANGQAKEGTGYVHLTEPHSKQFVRKSYAAVPILDRVYRHAPGPPEGTGKAASVGGDGGHGRGRDLVRLSQLYGHGGMGRLYGADLSRALGFTRDQTPCAAIFFPLFRSRMEDAQVRARLVVKTSQTVNMPVADPFPPELRRAPGSRSVRAPRPGLPPAQPANQE